MKKAISLLTAALLVLAVAAPAAAQADKIDSGIEFGPPVAENTFVNFNQVGSEGRVVVKLQKAQPDTSYYIEVWCGPDHDNAILDIAPAGASVETNRVGNGNSGAFFVDLTLCPSGDDRTGHVDVGAGGPEYTSQFTYSN